MASQVNLLIVWAMEHISTAIPYDHMCMWRLKGHRLEVTCLPLHFILWILGTKIMAISPFIDLKFSPWNFGVWKIISPFKFQILHLFSLNVSSYICLSFSVFSATVLTNRHMYCFSYYVSVFNIFPIKFCVLTSWLSSGLGYIWWLLSRSHSLCTTPGTF